MGCKKYTDYLFATLEPLWRNYFRSGWFFLIPYLVAYLAFWWRKWPVNPTSGGGWCLLHLYWFFHVVNAVFAVGAFLWRRTANSSRTQFARPKRGADFLRFLPWIALVLVFYVPSAYLEFPSDPWEHFSRINHWHYCGTVGDYYARAKSSYFLAYSLIGHLKTTGRQFGWLAVYHTGCCVLLSWQYYLLARAAGLRHQPAMVFTVIQAFLFGNNLFSFYRYYSIASTIFAQLGAVVFLRLTIDVIRRFGRFSSERYSRIVQSNRLTGAWLYWGRGMFLIGGGVCLLGLIAFNHSQALGIAGVGAGAVGVWCIFERQGLKAWWLAVVILLMSVGALLWWPRQPAIDAIYRPENWLTPWLGFNLFSLSSPAWERALAVLGISGLANLLAAVWLLRRNHIVGWLTVAPIAALTLPVVAIPFANILAGTEDSYIVSFNRLLLGIPAGLALVTAAAKFMAAQIGRVTAEGAKRYLRRQRLAFGALALVLLALTTLPAGGPAYNRLWNSLAIVPNDLQMRPATVLLDGAKRATVPSDNPPALVTTYHVGFIAFAVGLRDIATPAGRSASSTDTPAARAAALIDRITYVAETKQPAMLLTQPTAMIISPRSGSGALSQHWSREFVVLENTGMPEILEAARSRGVSGGDGGMPGVMLFPGNSKR